ncbi:MAG: Hsp20/alpha crystallin family protein [Acidimicrobiales bacterium]
MMKVRVLDDFERLANSFYASSQVSYAPLDFYRREDTYVAEFDLPGVNPDSIDISVENGTLSVSARRELHRSPNDSLIVSERSAGQYQRTLHLGHQLDVNGVVARFENGVLTVTIPVSENAKQRKIPVTLGNLEATVASTD